MKEIRFKYEMNTKKTISSLVFFGIIGALLLGAGFTNKKAISIWKFNFSQEASTTFYFVLAGISLLFVFLPLIGILKNKNTKREIIVGEKSISAPKSQFSNKIITIDFDQITKFYLEDVAETKSMILKTSNQKLVIYDIMISNKEKFQELFELVKERYKNN
ncbi:hypothetical protein [Aureivirga sp. CE67]|uniref:hypothetical protein n=1 Tax=Aureivirga sp. CE67 TaxID=1788983 RepID=UPI0018C9F684|nr:hypothetical protein [Aureivirga sp. CE67]